jgi:hypothetical protein
MLGVPWRHWRSYGTTPLPTPQEALGEPLRVFPSWFLRIEWRRRGTVFSERRNKCAVAFAADSSREGLRR